MSCGTTDRMTTQELETIAKHHQTAMEALLTANRVMLAEIENQKKIIEDLKIELDELKTNLRDTDRDVRRMSRYNPRDL